MSILSDIPNDQPVLIAGPTASGKSALALEIAQTQGGIIINGDAIQVYDNWRVLTARPSQAEETQTPHALYGHVAYDSHYSAGQWLRDLAPLLLGARPIIVGGTGLYFGALTNGLANIPQISAKTRALADRILEDRGTIGLMDDLDPETLARIDTKNPVRVQRAWEVQQETGKGLAQWHKETPAPLLATQKCHAIVFDVETTWLNDRIERRFDQMLAAGALKEAARNLEHWDPKHLSSKAIGAPQLIAHLKGEMSLEEARLYATIATRQFAKRQRTWFRAKMRDWRPFRPAS